MKVRSLLPLLLIVLGIFFTLGLVSQIPEEAYFSGDAGLKAILSKQLAEGSGRFDLVPPAQQWVQDLWQQGLYPYRPPYAYDLDHRYFIAFPYTFPLITAPFYKLFGYYGFYVVPLLAIWALWGLFYGACRLIGFSSTWTALGLGALIFASPLTLYGAMYWEHSLAVALAFTGLVLLLWAKQRERELADKVSIAIQGLAGVGLGLAAWFRQDFFCLIALLLAISVGQEFLKLPPIRKVLEAKGLTFHRDLISHPWAFGLSTVVTTGLYFVANLPVYGSFFGIPRVELLEVTFTQKLMNAIIGFQGMGMTFILFMPIVYFVVFYGLALGIDRQRLKPNIYAIAIVFFSLILLFLISFLVPAGTSGLIPGGKQWGTRFLLIIVPVLLLTLVQLLKSIVEDGRPWIKYGGIAIFSVLLLLSFHINTIDGSKFLAKNYQNLEPAIAFLKESPESVVAMSDQFVGQALEASLYRQKVWFKVENPAELSKFGQRLLEENVKQFIYICYPSAPCPLPEMASDQLAINYQNKNYPIHFKFIDKKGKYPIYKVSIH